MISPEPIKKLTHHEQYGLQLPSGIRPPRSKALARRIANFLAPSFFARNNVHMGETARPTDFLDGIRGYAAFVVFIHHFFQPVYPQWQLGYARSGSGENSADEHYITQLPFIRLIFSGPPCVSLFFVISGFSISLKPISLVRAGSFPQFLDTMVSATFRRTCRLYLPCLAMLLISLLLTCGGAYNYAYSRRIDWHIIVPQPHAPTMKIIKHWCITIFHWVDPLPRKPEPGLLPNGNPIPRKSSPRLIPYATQLWTIPAELRCSLICFIAIIGLAKVRPMVRMWCLSILAVYWHLKTNIDASLFLAGTVLAELFLIRQENAPKRTKQHESTGERVCNIAVFMLGLFLLGYPRKGGDNALFWGPFSPIATLIVGDAGDNPYNFFLMIGSVLLVYSVLRSPSLQPIFTSPLGRYLGKISFALYLVHQAMLLWFGYRTITFWWSVVGKEAIWQYRLGLGIAFLGQTVVTVWAADVFWRAIDLPSVKFARWLEEKCKSE